MNYDKTSNDILDLMFLKFVLLGLYLYTQILYYSTQITNRF